METTPPFFRTSSGLTHAELAYPGLAHGREGAVLPQMWGGGTSKLTFHLPCSPPSSGGGAGRYFHPEDKNTPEPTSISEMRFARAETLRRLEENTGVILCDSELGNGLLDDTKREARTDSPVG